MTGMAQRAVTAERLDHLAPDDPLAIRSRHDLRRIHRAMRSVTILKQAVAGMGSRQAPRRLLELGAGDGSLLLRLARAMHPHWRGMRATLLDQQDLISRPVRESFAHLDWQVDVLKMDALEWAVSAPAERYDLCVTTLFLHHFAGMELERLLAGIAIRTHSFIACEPRRSGLAHVGSRLTALLGANEVTREDSIKSVAAGFTGFELTALWSQLSGDWRIDEYGAWPFTHCFRTIRADMRAAD